MKKIVSIVALSVLPCLSVQAASYSIDPSHTYPNFSLKRMFSTLYGQFSKTTGTFGVTLACVSRNRSTQSML